MAELKRVEPVIGAAYCKKLLMCSALDDVTAVEDEYLVCVNDGRQTMRNHEHGSPFE
jgi:hypothetical protein